MQFNSIQYIVFLAAVTAVYYFLPLTLRKVLLVAASFVFYMAWNKKCILLMLAVILLTYGAALLLARMTHERKAVLTGTLLATLALLVYFKYLNFILDTLNHLFRAGFAIQDIILPVGISFYIFQSLGYVIDVYRDPAACEKNLLNYALFISFFPQLVAGPIERSSNMLEQLRTKQPFSLPNIKNGITLILIGMVEKVVIADRLAIFVNGVFTQYTQAGTAALMLAAVFFAFQVYCDFGAYSLIAIGSARLMGYRLMRNFEHPYLSRSFSEYWSRWHISLSSWFEDYIFTPYVWSNPLRFAQPPMRTGLLLVFLVSGFWHGANWTFVVWGLCHALFRIVESSTARPRKKFYKKHHIDKNAPALAALQVIFTFGLNCITYVFFRADSIGQALDYLRRIFSGSAASAALTSFGMAQGELLLSILLICGLAVTECLQEKQHPGVPADELLEQRPVALQALIYAGLLLLLAFCGEYGASYVQNPFIYFQF